MKDLTITYALDTSGKIVHVEKACKDCRYYCIECRKELSLRVSKIPKGQKYHRRSHFSHQKDSLCHPETVLHNQFKKMAAAKLQSCLTDHKPFKIFWNCEECYDRHQYDLMEGIAAVKLEYRLKDCQPDITLLSADNTVKAVLEVVVNHKPEPQVVKYYKDQGIIMVRIDLQSFDDLDRLEERIKEPTKVMYCLSPVCEVCGKRKNLAQMRIVDTSCWKCHHPMKMAMIVHEHHNILGPDDFSEEERCIAQKHGVSIEHRYSQTVEDSYFANVCRTCNAFIGKFHLHNYYYIESYKCIDSGYKCFECFENADIEQEKSADQEQLFMVLPDEIRPCPECGGLLELKKGIYGPFFGCCNYPECRYTVSIDRANISPE